MKKTINRIMAILIMLIMLFNPCISYADETVEGDASMGLPTINSGYKPTVADTGTAITIISSILSVLTGLGVIAIVVSVAIMGFGMILGSASEKAVAKERGVGIVIAGLLLTGGSVIAKMIISVVENL